MRRRRVEEKVIGEISQHTGVDGGIWTIAVDKEADSLR
jgi:hypothetical protein